MRSTPSDIRGNDVTLDGRDAAQLRALLQAPQAYVTLNATLPDASFFASLPKTFHVAADGAGLRLRALGVEPDLVIGDLDSLGADHGFAAERIIRIADQDSCDFEKCLVHCLSLGLNTVMVLGLHGGELEHTLNNWSVFTRFATQMSLCMYDAGRLGFAVHQKLRLPTRRGEMISFIPQPQANMTSSGVKWPLTRTDLKIGGRDGARNRATDDAIELTVHSGTVLTFCDAGYDRFGTV